ncbi:MAG: MotA/TolQ/ExbB proton channel family protein [Thermoanaerobaculia bacterium]|nr:MotA/TolQ/ExbB proton channel family protein [Thermoanaerobaculia bacterium]
MSAALLTVLAQAHADAPSIFELFWRSGPMAKFVLGLLVALSLGSWAIMLGKYRQLKRSAAATRKFLATFRKSSRFSEVNQAAEGLKDSPLVGIFKSGYIEIDAQIKALRSDSGRGEGPAYRMKSFGGLERSLRRAVAAELQVLRRGTGFLATTASASPFIGLFGTVWGIMVAFQDIGLSGSTSLVAVAPGIAEALINTAAGLAAAIPALLGYNYFVNQIRDWRSELDDFVLEFLNLAERNFT